jgi:hypothetical protein
MGCVAANFLHMPSGNLASQARHELVSPQETIASRNVVWELAGTGYGCGSLTRTCDEAQNPKLQRTGPFMLAAFLRTQPRLEGTIWIFHFLSFRFPNHARKDSGSAASVTNAATRQHGGVIGGLPTAATPIKMSKNAHSRSPPGERLCIHGAQYRT